MLFGNEKMKKITFSIFLALSFFSVANSTIIEVEIPQYLFGNFTSFSYDSSKDILKFWFEFYNSGSTAYRTRMRLDVLNDSRIIFTGWSDEKVLMPGDRKNFEIYWYTNSTGNFSARVRAYFGNEILERKFSLEKNNSFSPEDVFEIKNFRTYDDFIVFDIKAKRNAKDVVILPSDFPLGWIFEQKKIDFLKEGEERTVAIDYHPTAWTEGKLNLIVASNDGRYKTEERFEMKKEAGILWLIYYLTDMLKLFIRAA
jgi:hypothetical protein